MTNTNSPFGFSPDLIAEVENRYATYTITSGYGTALYAGDPVKISGGVNGLANLVIASPGDKIAGIFKGVTWANSSGYVRRTNYWPAGNVATQIIAYVSDDPFTRYRVQLSGAYSDADIGQLADFVSGSGNPTSLSAYALDSTTVGTGTGFLITDVFQTPNNLPGSFAQVEVVPMKQIYRS